MVVPILKQHPYIFIIDLGLDPVHEESNVLGGGEVGGLLILDAVLPQILELWSPGHRRTALPCTLKYFRDYILHYCFLPFCPDLFTNCSIYQVDSVEEIHNVNSQPIIKILSLWQLDNLSQVDTRIKTSLKIKYS